MPGSSTYVNIFIFTESAAMIRQIRTFALLAAAVSVPAVAASQAPRAGSSGDQQFKVGTVVLSAGLLLGAEGYGYSGVGLGGALEVGVGEIAGQVRLGVGGGLGVLRHDYGRGLSDYTQTTIPLTGFVNGHYQLEQVPKLDLFAGPVVGIALRRYSWDGDVFDDDDFDDDLLPVAGVQAGGRYEFAPRVMASLQASAGTNLPWLTAGVAFKF